LECGDGFISNQTHIRVKRSVLVGKCGGFWWRHCVKTIAPAFANSPSDWVTNAQKASTKLTGSSATRLRRNIEETTKHTGGGSLEPREFVMKRPFDSSLKNLWLRKHQRLFAVSPRSSDMPMATTFTENFLTSAVPSRVRLEAQTARRWDKIRLALETACAGGSPPTLHGVASIGVFGTPPL